MFDSRGYTHSRIALVWYSLIAPMVYFWRVYIYDLVSEGIGGIEIALATPDCTGVSIFIFKCIFPPGVPHSSVTITREIPTNPPFSKF